MSPRSMDIFSLRDTVVSEYRSFARSFTTIAAADISEQVEAIYAEDRYWPEPLVQINPRYKRGKDVAQLAGDGLLHPRCAEIFRSPPPSVAPEGRPLPLYLHQERAVAKARDRQSFVVTTGTGSGKSLCFFVPIVSAVLAEKEQGGVPKTRAIVIYPMNALANSQMGELERFLPSRSANPPVTFGRYTGQDDQVEREAIAASPPDILLTNFMMLELLMTRQDPLDRKVMGNCAGLRFLVLDELHTYRGRQGADVAMLVRRVRERLAPDDLLCIGTSATMKSEGSLEDRNRVVAEVASKLFAVEVPPINVIGETLERVTDPELDHKKVGSALGPILDLPILTDLSDAALRIHPLAVWVETRLGVTFSEPDQRWIRARPLSLKEASEQLACDAIRPVTQCREALRQMLLITGRSERERTGSPDASDRVFFPFRLHQFISGAGYAYATLEPPGQRAVTVEGQRFLPGSREERRLYPVHFCRECGQEYHPIRIVYEEGRRRALARSIDDAAITSKDDKKSEAPPDADEYGFLMMQPADDVFTFKGAPEDYPESWQENDAQGGLRLKSSFRELQARRERVRPDGLLEKGAEAWFLPGRFRLCLRCGETYGGNSRDRNRLASLSAEGRSSATTVLTLSVLRWMHGLDSGLDTTTRKLLGFSDNRQDAALQAGHFNDFLFVSMTRSAFLRALNGAGAAGLRSADLGAAQQRALGFDLAAPELRAEWLLEPGLRGFNLQEAEATLRQVLAYRVWFDQRRGWRYTNPNLEQLGLVQVEYLGLDALAADQELFDKAHPLLRGASAAVRAVVYRQLFDHMRRGMAIRSNILERLTIDQMLARSHSRLRAPWGVSLDEKPRAARWLILRSPNRRTLQSADEELIVRGGARSALGRALKDSTLWGGDLSARKLKSVEVEQILGELLRAAKEHGQISAENTPFDVDGWRLVDDAILFMRGDPPADSRREHDFFRDLFTNLAAMLGEPVHPLFGFEAREHTAQVEQDKRQIRELRFRYGKQEQQDLAERSRELRDLGESDRFLPVLFCSPTMELGVDISELNAVYLRNLPPTPANYAQRSGRAGRGGQPALVLTYASAQGPHDQYYFRDPGAMVHGEVRAPTLDLANRDLIDSHLQAIWLACTREPLSPAISELLTLELPERPIRPEVQAPMEKPEVAAEARRSMVRVLNMVAINLKRDAAPWYPGPETYAAQIAAAATSRFDRALDRWRDLFLSAEQQRDLARRVLDDYSAPPADKRAAKSRHGQAMEQIDLLQKGSSTGASSDFYTYRYLATEGFLPGYNFPRLPLMAYIPTTTENRGRHTFLQRPRFLALSEFGPHSLVYHEGRAYRVVRAMLPLSQRDQASADAHLPTLTIYVCRSCGAGHDQPDVSLCHACQSPLGTAEVIRDAFRIENVATRSVERITANDEERQRQGFELQTIFAWARRDHAADFQRGEARDAEGKVADLTYGTGATITRLNKGLRRRAHKSVLGFHIDPVSGTWEKENQDEGDDTPDPMIAAPQRIVPYVLDHKNALLFRPEGANLSQKTLATVQHALLRGLSALFQLEEAEVLAEPMPSRDKRNSALLYEATEGGAGVLTRLVGEEQALARVARRALQIMHFAVDDEAPMLADPERLVDQPDSRCVAACYRCLLSYYNQPDHELIDRRDHEAKSLLLRLAGARIEGLTRAGPASLPSADASGSPEDRLRGDLQARGLPSPDPRPLHLDGSAVPLVWRAHYVVVMLDEAPEPLLRALDDQGFDVLQLRKEESWGALLHHLATALGRAT